MQTENYENAGEELDQKAHAYADKRGCSYAEAVRHIAATEPDLARRYAFGESETDREIRKGAEEFDEYVRNYQSELRLTRREAERQVGQHVPKVRAYAQDPAIKIYSQGGQIVMNTEKVPLSAESVLDVRAQELIEKGEIKSYQEAMRAVLDEDPHLKFCYSKNLPYHEASARKYQEDPMRSQVVQGIVGPPPTGQATWTEMPSSEPGTTAMQELGVLINGARLADNSPDVALMLKIANLTPDLVRAASQERLNAIAYKLIDILGLTGVRSDRFPEAYVEAVRRHPGLAASAKGGVMNEEALREIFFGWFSRERD